MHVKNWKEIRDEVSVKENKANNYKLMQCTNEIFKIILIRVIHNYT